MRVHLIKEKTIRLFVAQYPGSRLSFEEWLTKVKLANWELPGDLKQTFPSADLLGKGTSRVIFDIAGNRYRVIGKYAFGETEVHLFVCWIGTHVEYDKLCKEEKQYTVTIY